MENTNKKSLKWLWIAIAIIAVVALAVWCTVNAIVSPKTGKDGVVNVFNFSTTFVLFVTAFLIVALGYLLGGIDITEAQRAAAADMLKEREIYKA